MYPMATDDSVVFVPVCAKGGRRGPARHRTSIRWARLIGGGERAAAGPGVGYREDRPTSSLPDVSTSKEQCVVVVSLLRLKLRS